MAKLNQNTRDRRRLRPTPNQNPLRLNHRGRNRVIRRGLEVTVILVVIENVLSAERRPASDQKNQRKQNVTDRAVGRLPEIVELPTPASTARGVTKANHTVVVLVRIVDDRARAVARGRRVVAEKNIRNRRGAMTAIRNLVVVAATPAIPEDPGIIDVNEMPY